MNIEKNIHVFAIAAQGKGISGGDRIFIEFARRWQKKAKITIYVNQEGREMCQRQDLLEGKNLKYVVWNTQRLLRHNFVITYFVRIFKSIIEAFKLTIDFQQSTILYSASEFWMDSLPVLILKFRYPKAIWAAAWYQTAPDPLRGYAEGKRERTYNFKALLYWLAQIPIKPIISKFADYVLVNNEMERSQFPNLDTKKRIVVVIGAIDLYKIAEWRKSHGGFSKICDAVFQGRFHPQKGVVELMDIWKEVVAKKPDAKLVMIGDGPLMKDVKSKISDLKLENNIKLLGYVFDGDKKYRIFTQSKIVVHPAFYDSGGMAAAEAMAFGLPCVGFNLRSYESYYPQGMLKVKLGDNHEFAKAILTLLKNDDLRKKISKDALKMLNNNWSWEKRADEVWNSIFLK